MGAASVADALANNNDQPADRQGSCIAEIGYSKGLRVTPDFSALCCDPDVLEPTVAIEVVDEPDQGKLAWVSGYLDAYVKVLCHDQIRSGPGHSQEAILAV